MIEPTETETKEELDGFIAAMIKIQQEAENSPELLKEAPHTQPVRRLDEVRAAKQLDLTWKPAGPKKLVTELGRWSFPKWADCRKSSWMG